MVAACGAAVQESAPPAGPLASATPLAARPVVALQAGEIRGVVQDGVRVFRGIPYAAPPVGRLRWRPPQPVQSWSGVKDCSLFGPSCPQAGAPDRSGTLGGQQSEDCLYLNVWTPARSTRDRLPVMVWIHGGGFISGSGSLPDAGGVPLCRTGNVIVVSFNYRLGVFGFFAHAQLSQETPHHVSGNYGLLDQMAALRWVKHNIAAFGGDPKRVTIFGQSAGGQSVIALLVSPLSRGLFSAAAAESPRYEDRGVGLWSTLTLEEQEQEGEEVADDLGIENGPGALTALRRVSAVRLLNATVARSRALPLMFVQPPQPSFQPVVDGWVLPDQPRRLLSKGRRAPVPLLIGSNRDECNMWLGDVRPGSTDYVAQASRQRVAWFTGPDWPALASSFPASRYGGLLPATSRMMTVLEFNAAARYGASRAALRPKATTPSYLYYFTRVPPHSRYGAFHGAEVPYIFGNMQESYGPEVDADDAALSGLMMRYWTRFAATGDPNEPDLPIWERYEPKTDRLLRLDEPVAMVRSPYRKTCAVAERVQRER